MSTKNRMTVGESVEQHGFCEAMCRIADLAAAVGRIPFGEWDYRFVSDPAWRVCVNGGPEKEWTPLDAGPIPRFHAMVEKHGWPAALVNAAGGTVCMAEAEILAAIDTEIARVKEPKS